MPSVEHRKAVEAAQLDALCEAARIGFADIDAGRYREIDDNDLDNFISALADRACKLASPDKT